MLCLLLPTISQAQDTSATPPLTMATTLSVAADTPQPPDLALSAPSAPADSTPAVAAATTSTEVPADAAPLLKLGPGDMVALQVYGRPELSVSTYVGDDGKITVPLAGQVAVAGLSPAEASAKVADAYRSGGYLLQPQVNLTLQQFRSQQISVLGEVHTPGRYSLESRTSIFDLLAQAGGASPDAADTLYLLRRDSNGQLLRVPISMRDLVQHTGPELALRGGDSIYVPKAPQFYIYGEVHSPNRYKLDPGMTVVQALAMGGGVTDRGSDSRIEIRRHNPDGSYKTFSARPGDEVQADDVIRVKERIF